MLKVECEACKAPYQVDEKRIPPTGLKMRCPKCGTAFTVQNPNGPQASASPGPPPAPKPFARATMVGTGIAIPPAAAAPAAPPPPPADDMGLGDDPFAPLPEVKRPAPPGGPASAPGAGATVMGTGVGVGRAPPAPLGAIDELMDLPAMPPPKPAAASPVLPLPQVKPTLASRQSPPSKAQPPSLSDFDIDLPSPVADLPAKPSAAAKPPAPGGLTFDVDLPAARPELPSAKGGPPPKPKKPPPPAPGRGGQADLPSPAHAGLPVVAGNVGLPAIGGAGLPAVGGALPAVAQSLPAVGRQSFGSIDLPSTGGSLPAPLNSLPASVDQGQYLPNAAAGNLPMAMGNEMHLPQAMDALPSAVSDAGYLPENLQSLPAALGGGGGDFDASLVRNPSVSPSIPAAQPTPGGQGGLAYGELDFGSDAGGGEVAAEEIERPAVSQRGVEAAFPEPAATAKPRERVVIKKGQSNTAKIVAGVIAATVIGGTLLQFTKHGAFGWHDVSDGLNKSTWRKLADDDLQKARKALGADVYDKARAAADAIENEAAGLPRAKALTAAAALTEYEYQLRFGHDAARATRALGWLQAIEKDTGSPEKVQYYAAAAAGRAAVNGELPQAVTLLDAAAQRDTGDPVQQDVALMRGEVALAAKDAKGAVTAFTRALGLAPSARANFGLARAYVMQGDPTKARASLASVLTATPGHPGATVLKAELDWDVDRNESAVLEGLKPLLDGPGKESASTAELSRAYTTRGLVEAARGNIGDARQAFEAALKLDPKNVRALVGQGEVFFTEGRNTEALSRFDTAVQTEPGNAIAIVADAKAKISLERLADAKAQLAAAQLAQPKNMMITYWLGRAHEVLGDKKSAENSYLLAITLSNPKDRDAILPYVSLSELLAGEGRETEAQSKLEEARAKLPDSAAMQRALGEVAAVRGLFEEAITHYQSAIAKDPRDLGARFLLGVTYRRMQKLDEASAQFEIVAAADKDYPNLAMERGLVFEQSGHIDQAFQTFQSALQKAPMDLDLQLRVGAAEVGLGKADEAIKLLKGVFDKRQNSAEVCHYLGRAYFLQGGGSLVDAARYLRRAVELDPNRAEYHLYLAWVATESDPIDIGTAKTEVKKALALDQLLADAYWQRGIAERIEGAVEDAIADEQKALKLRPTRVEAHAVLAQCYENKNLPDKAIAEWNIAIAQNDEKPDWQYGLGKLLYDRGGASQTAALPHLLVAVTEWEKATRPPGYLPQAEFMVAQGFFKQGKKTEAKEHYKWFMRTSQSTSPDRKEAKARLKALGDPWEDAP